MNLASRRCRLGVVAFLAVLVISGCSRWEWLTPSSPKQEQAAAEPAPAIKPPTEQAVAAASTDEAAVKPPADDELSRRINDYINRLECQPPPRAKPKPADRKQFLAGASPSPKPGPPPVAQTNEPKPVAAAPADRSAVKDKPLAPPAVASAGDGNSNQFAVPAPANEPPGETIERPATATPAKPQVMSVQVKAASANETAGLADAISAAEAAARDKPADFRTQLQLRALYLAAGRTDDAKTPWSAGTRQHQEALASWVKATAALAGGSDDAVAAVDSLRTQIGWNAPLKVCNVRLVSQVRGFGNLTPFADDSYRPGQWVVVYCELDNFTSQPADDGHFATRLSQRVELLSADGRSVLAEEDKQIEDRSLNCRRDFFLARRLKLPADLPAGEYVLRVSIEDKQAAKVGESMVRFAVK